MFEKNLKLAYLLDIYSEALDERTKNVMKAYYDDDLSLSEIASGEDISRQGVRHIIKKGEEQLDFLERALGLAERSTELSKGSEELIALATLLREGGDREQIANGIERVAHIIQNKTGA